MRRLVAACALFSLLAFPAGASALDASGLRAKLSREMRLAGARGGAFVQDLQTGTTLFAAREDVARPPASVQKLYTTSTALLRLGPGATFTTDVLTTGEPDAEGILRGGPLWLRGGGDPTLTTARVRALATQLTASGIASVPAGVAGDGTVFDALPGSFRTGGRYDRDMGGALAGLVVNRGLIHGRGQAAPSLIAARALAHELRRRAVRITGRTWVEATQPEAHVLASTTSAPLGKLIAQTNTPSDNFYAETLLKDLGARFGAAGTTAGGAAVVSAQLASFGVHPRIADGSGLARDNRTTPRQIVRLLARMDGQDQAAGTFRASLPVAGRTGTLRRRMRGTPAAGRCQAKTGTISYVSALAGYCATQNGRTVAFAVMMSGMNVYSARRIQDRMTAAIARVTLTK